MLHHDITARAAVGVQRKGAVILALVHTAPARVPICGLYGPPLFKGGRQRHLRNVVIRDEQGFCVQTGDGQLGVVHLISDGPAVSPQGQNGNDDGHHQQRGNHFAGRPGEKRPRFLPVPARHVRAGDLLVMFHHTSCNGEKAAPHSATLFAQIIDRFTARAGPAARGLTARLILWPGSRMQSGRVLSPPAFGADGRRRWRRCSAPQTDSPVWGRWAR